MPSKRPKILVLLGPTASGKSDLAVTLAKKLNGEIVSADSRQVYRGLDIGSGKITKREMRGITHYLLDVVSPQKRFTVNDYQKLAYKAIDEILARGKLPIVCGGTGFYIQSLVDGIVLPDVDPQNELREKFDKLKTEKLFLMLTKLDPKKAEQVDPNNRPRIIRAMEIATVLGKNPSLVKRPRYNAFQIGLTYSLLLLQERIEKRLIKRLKGGMINEVKNLHKAGISWKKLNELGLEYKYISQYLQKKIGKEEMISILNTKIFQYAKRQMTWFKRDERVWWVDIG